MIVMNVILTKKYYQLWRWPCDIKTFWLTSSSWFAKFNLVWLGSIKLTWHFWEPNGHYGTLLNHLQSLLDHGTIWETPGPFLTIWDYVWVYWTIWRRCWNIWESLMSPGLHWHQRLSSWLASWLDWWNSFSLKELIFKGKQCVWWRT